MQRCKLTWWFEFRETLNINFDPFGLRPHKGLE